MTGINLVDTKKFEVGTVEWQDAMIHNISQKIEHNEELGRMEKIFIVLQKEHNKKLVRENLLTDKR